MLSPVNGLISSWPAIEPQRQPRRGSQTTEAGSPRHVAPLEPSPSRGLPADAGRAQDRQPAPQEPEPAQARQAETSGRPAHGEAVASMALRRPPQRIDAPNPDRFSASPDPRASHADPCIPRHPSTSAPILCIRSCTRTDGASAHPAPATAAASHQGAQTRNAPCADARFPSGNYPAERRYRAAAPRGLEPSRAPYAPAAPMSGFVRFIDSRPFASLRSLPVFSGWFLRP